jgi:hypothetical protein
MKKNLAFMTLFSAMVLLPLSAQAAGGKRIQNAAANALSDVERNNAVGNALLTSAIRTVGRVQETSPNIGSVLDYFTEDPENLTNAINYLSESMEVREEAGLPGAILPGCRATNTCGFGTAYQIFQQQGVAPFRGEIDD